MYRPAIISIPVPVATGFDEIVNDIGALPVGVTAEGTLEYAPVEEIGGELRVPFELDFRPSEGSVKAQYMAFSNNPGLPESSGPSILLGELSDIERALSGTADTALADADHIEKPNPDLRAAIQRSQSKFGNIKIPNLLSILKSGAVPELEREVRDLIRVLGDVAKLASSDDPWTMKCVSRTIGEIDHEKAADYRLLAGALSFALGNLGDMVNAEVSFHQSALSFIEANRYTSAAMVAEYAAIARDAQGLNGKYRNPYRDMAEAMWTAAAQNSLDQDHVGFYVSWLRSVQNAASAPFPNANAVAILYSGMSQYLIEAGERDEAAETLLRSIAWLLRNSRLNKRIWPAIVHQLETIMEKFPEWYDKLMPMSEAAREMGLPDAALLGSELREIPAIENAAVRETVERAARLYNLGEFEAAGALFGGAFRDTGEYAFIYNAAVSLFMGGSFYKSISCFKGAMVLGGFDDAAANFDIAKAFFSVGGDLTAPLMEESVLDSLREGSCHLNVAIEMEPENVEYLMLRGAARMSLGNTRGAVQDLKLARKIDPDNVKTIHDLGTAYIAKGYPNTALDVLDDGIERNPGHPLLLRARSLARGMTEDYAGAMEDAKAACELDPYDSENWSTLRIAMEAVSEGKRI